MASRVKVVVVRLLMVMAGNNLRPSCASDKVVHLKFSYYATRKS